MPRETDETYFYLTPEGWIQGGERPPNTLKVVIHIITDYRNGYSVDNKWQDVWDSGTPEPRQALAKHGSPVHRVVFPF